jgi:hypothetical protein
MANVRLRHRSQCLSPSTCPAIPHAGCYQVLTVLARPRSGAVCPWCFRDQYVVVRGQPILLPGGLPGSTMDMVPVPEDYKDEVRALLLDRGHRAGLDVPRRSPRLTEPLPHCWKIRTLAPERQVPPQAVSYKRGDDD